MWPNHDGMTLLIVVLHSWSESLRLGGGGLTCGTGSLEAVASCCAKVLLATFGELGSGGGGLGGKAVVML